MTQPVIMDRPALVREIVADLTKHNGAWLISLTDLYEKARTGRGEHFDCASSITAAKRLAVEWSKEHKYEGDIQWGQYESGDWWLSMCWVMWIDVERWLDEDYEDEDQ